MKLICYPTSGTPPKIRPAPAARDWMDATPSRFAVRCLPLTIANAAGWEILNPAPFSAVWDGGESLDAVQIDGQGSQPAAISHFGSGILTFHVHGLFETPPGVLLWASGAPNRLKDGIQPLTGLIETSWSPYTFTMNWKFTRGGQRIHFERDEPYCFIMPLNLAMTEAAEPEFRNLDERHDLAANYRQWTASRQDFNTDLKMPGSKAQAEKWQKTYHQGVRPDGSKADAEHRTKVQLKPFVDNTKP